MTGIQPVLDPSALGRDVDVPLAPTQFRAKFRQLFSHSLLFAIGTVLVVISLLLAIFGPLIAPYDPIKPTSDVLQGPSGAHWFGTDSSGLDIFSRVIAGARIDITIALLATGISVVVGSFIGLLASFSQGRFGSFVLRTSDVLQAFPLFVLAIIYVTAVGRSASNIVAVVAVFNIPIYIRLIRTQVVALRNRAFVEAARANGSRESWIAIRHVLPNSLSPVWAQASITLGATIIVTAGLSYIGAGIRPPTPEWGSMIASGANGIVIGQWWMSVFPGLAMSLSVFGFAAFGNGMQKIVAAS
jgi:peptide/nickel transport system permease protein